jgi:hypothetical protein
MTRHFLEQLHSGMHFLHANGLNLPFRDRSFDVVHSFAVLEHVGSLDNQARFISLAPQACLSGHPASCRTSLFRGGGQSQLDDPPGVVRCHRQFEESQLLRLAGRERAPLELAQQSTRDRSAQVGFAAPQLLAAVGGVWLKWCGAVTAETIARSEFVRTLFLLLKLWLFGQGR